MASWYRCGGSIGRRVGDLQVREADPRRDHAAAGMMSRASHRVRRRVLPPLRPGPAGPQPPQRVAHLADGVLGLCRWWGIPVRSLRRWARRRDGGGDWARQRRPPMRSHPSTSAPTLPALRPRAGRHRGWRPPGPSTSSCARGCSSTSPIEGDDGPSRTGRRHPLGRCPRGPHRGRSGRHDRSRDLRPGRALALRHGTGSGSGRTSSSWAAASMWREARQCPSTSWNAPAADPSARRGTMRASGHHVPEAELGEEPLAVGAEHGRRRPRGRVVLRRELDGIPGHTKARQRRIVDRHDHVAGQHLGVGEHGGHVVDRRARQVGRLQPLEPAVDRRAGQPLLERGPQLGLVLASQLVGARSGGRRARSGAPRTSARRANSVSLPAARMTMPSAAWNAPNGVIEGCLAPSGPGDTPVAT